MSIPSASSLSADFPIKPSEHPIYYRTPVTRTYHIDNVILHGGGVANSCSYPYITISFNISFTRRASNDENVYWEITDIVWTHPDELKDFSYAYRALIDIDFYLHETSLQILADKDVTAVGSNWFNAFIVPERLSGMSPNKNPYSNIYILASGGKCQNNGEYCFGDPGYWTILYTKQLEIPSYAVSNSPINGAGGGDTSTNTGGAYKVVYDANYGINAPATQNRSAGSPLILTTAQPTYPITMTYFVSPGSKTADDYDYARTISRPFLGWQSCYKKNNRFSVDYTCDGQKYDFSIRYGWKSMDGDDDILITLPNGQRLTVYHYTSGKEPQSSKYPYYYSIEQKWIGYDTLSPDVLHIGMIKSGIFSPSAPPEGAHIIMGYYGTQDSYSQYGAVYQPGDTYNPTGDLATKDVYMLAKWGTPTTVMPEAPDYFKVVTFNYMGGTGPYPTMNVPRQILGYKLWGYDWLGKDKGPFPDADYQVGESYEIHYGTHTDDEPDICFNIPGLNLALTTQITMGLVALPGSAIVYRNKLPAGSKPGYIFDCWCYDAALTQPIAETTEITATSEGLTLYARYTEIPIRQFNSDGTWKPYTPKVWRFNGSAWVQDADVYRYTNGEWYNISGG